MKEDTTEIVVIVDRSGSMGGKQQDVIGGFNTFLKEQKALPGKAQLTYAQFNDRHDIVHDGKDIYDVPELTDKDYQPCGMTRLLDAVGKTFNTVGERLAKTPEEERPAHVIVVIITDGHENDSQEFNYKQVQDMIRTQKDDYNWEIMFMASKINAVAEGAKFGVRSARSYQAADNSLGTRGVYECLSSNVSRMRTGRKLVDNDGQVIGE
jgi:uncharacterized protein YegL